MISRVNPEGENASILCIASGKGREEFLPLELRGKPFGLQGLEKRALCTVRAKKQKMSHRPPTVEKTRETFSDLTKIQNTLAMIAW